VDCWATEIPNISIQISVKYFNIKKFPHPEGWRNLVKLDVK